MAYDMALDVGITDYAVSRAIMELNKHHDRYSSEEIAQHIGCSVVTVRRTLPRLIKAKRVTREGDNHRGYKFEVVSNG